MLVFDLDDTLYSELEFVQSGFAAVHARLLALDYPEQPYAQTFWDVFEVQGSGRVFNAGLDALQCRYSPELIGKLVHTYRHHDPTISPRSGIPELLEAAVAAGFRLGIITDGAPAIQPGKLQALKLSHLFEEVICTDELGPDRRGWKPSPLPFATLEERADLEGPAMMYIGDNPTKDFDGALARGWKAVRLRLPDQLHHEQPTPPGVTEVDAVSKVAGAWAA
jgi:putative hydrolase of the HAD superfamily